MGEKQKKMVAAAGAMIVVGGSIWVMSMLRNSNNSSSSSKDYIMKVMSEMRDWMGIWAIPAYVALHTITLALCLPYAVFFEAGASILFGFFTALLCVFSAKILAASFSFFLGRYNLHNPCLIYHILLSFSF